MFIFLKTFVIIQTTITKLFLTLSVNDSRGIGNIVDNHRAMWVYPLHVLRACDAIGT